jgi:hypothetical protein
MVLDIGVLHAGISGIFNLGLLWVVFDAEELRDRDERIMIGVVAVPF